ncbi:primosomal protein N' [Pleionea sp. CnH1-48]|uniref:primosomal protein N' n=1 Tax=Pleionea sp. CnH1-48 TaxID=2954494 RepID=UPI00209750AB|nr:primosomal protein N' [Pleionea sp. CnH1-48]MCO7224484.1 primosomal protein N' [Pleionea sp. CnH1-48]
MPAIVRVALPVPLRRLFDYTLPEHFSLPELGTRVEVPFGKQTLIGLVVEHPAISSVEVEKLKSIHQILDLNPVVSESLWKLLHWCGQYYQHPLGDVLATALPNALMKGKPASLTPQVFWHLTSEAPEDWQQQLPANAVKLRKVMQLVTESGKDGINQSQFSQHDIALSQLKNLSNKGWLEARDEQPSDTCEITPSELQLTDEQREVVEKVLEQSSSFAPTLLEGVTGSGKTEVYLRIIAGVLQQQKQALVLIPEIGLTPQTLTRFEQRFPGQVGILHSGLTDNQRLQTWLKAQLGQLRVIIGTRSAIFTDMQDLGVIIIDEEHDLSFKQQDGLRYSSRDLAIIKARNHNIPVVLGSATPSLESLNNAVSGRYQHLHLKQRAQAQPLPPIRVIDCRDQPMIEGMSHPLLQQIEKHLKQDGQVLVFINRRGFAPVLMCHRCGWIADCHRCDRYMTLHQSANNKGFLQCHHCGAYSKQKSNCPKCDAGELLAIGQGTERIEQALGQRFPGYAIQRIDRDTTRRKQAMEQYVAEAKSGQTRILVGTQMLAKGHHFPNVTLVAILDIDGALFSSDFRAPERAAQLITQVAGRAGRAEKSGEVYVQSHHPEHPLLVTLSRQDYATFAAAQLQERAAALFPPFSYMAIFRAESNHQEKAEAFLREIKATLNRQSHSVELLGPVASTITRKSGRFRFQLLLNSQQRQPLHQLIQNNLNDIDKLPLANRVRWSLDIDPQDLL